MQEVQIWDSDRGQWGPQMLHNVGTIPKLMIIAESCCHFQWYSYLEQSKRYDLEESWCNFHW